MPHSISRLTLINTHRAIICDENIPWRFIALLCDAGYVVISIYEKSPGISDIDILKYVVDIQGLLLTFDKDFGDMIIINPFIPLEQMIVVLLRCDIVQHQDRIYETITQVILQTGYFHIIGEQKVRSLKVS